MFNHALTVGGDGTLDRVTIFDDVGGFISALTPSGNRSLWGEYVQDEISYNSWLRVLGALREDGYICRAAATAQPEPIFRPS
jgi:hemoglobin/transferrin/lactoferrin receptor protein